MCKSLRASRNTPLLIIMQAPETQSVAKVSFREGGATIHLLSSRVTSPKRMLPSNSLAGDWNRNAERWMSPSGCSMRQPAIPPDAHP
jgi:hypothetical protein